MSLYVSLRFKGIVKKELREIFEPIAMEGLWRESPDEYLRDFGEAYLIAYAIPCYSSCIIERWQKEPWERSYNKETREWIFQSDINEYSFPFGEWMKLFLTAWNQYLILKHGMKAGTSMMVLPVSKNTKTVNLRFLAILAVTELLHQKRK